MSRKPKIPQERSETIRQALLRLLAGNRLQVDELSKELRKSEKEVYFYLDQLNEAGKLALVPAECGKCGYRFEHRKKTKKPSKCPNCKSTYIRQPQYTLQS